MKFAIYLPPKVGVKAPVIYWLSGLTCTEQNFMTKAGAQQYAAEYNMIVVAPDTSPRNCGIPGEDDSDDFGTGAGFYVDATQEPWSKNYRMYSYITQELPEVIAENFPADPERQSIMGHSMGGHGALVCYLRNPGKYRSVSTFSAICNPSACPWGRKAFSGYLGGSPDNPDPEWKKYDATHLMAHFDGPPVEILLDQGGSDVFLERGQLLPQNLTAACKEAQVPFVLHMREGYDHSYFYIATFIGEHFKHHDRYLNM